MHREFEMTAIAPPSRRWVFGPIPDLLLGCGLGYALLIAVLPLVPVEARTLVLWGTLGTLVIGAPHYGATLLRVYGSAEDRRKYAFFSVYLTAIVWLWFAVGLYDLRVGSAMITLYLTWSPYHYTGQNYGLAVMFLRRRDIEFSAGTKRLLYASFMLSFALTALSLHRALSGIGATSYGIGDFAGTPFYFIHLGFPLPFWRVAFGIVGTAYIGVTWLTLARLLRTATARGLVPVMALMLAQALWFSLPNAWIWSTNTTLESQNVAWLFVWAILGHSVQYLWITTYYAVGRDTGRKRWTYLLATLAAGSAIWTLPALAFSPQTMGTHPYTMGLFLMIAAAVNLHHFILDGAIWKLRDTGVGGILLASPTEPTESGSAERARRHWVAPAAWIAGAAFIVLSLYGAAEQVRWSSRFEAGDYAAAQQAAQRLRWIGRADPRMALADAWHALASGDLPAAERALEESLALYPTADATFSLAVLQLHRGETDRAVAALQASLQLDPKHSSARIELARHLVRTGEIQEAIHHYEIAARLPPFDSSILVELVAARAQLTSSTAR